MKARPGAGAVVLAIGVVAGALWSVAPAWSHAGLVASEPADGSTLEAAPTTVRLIFSEEPQPSLSTIRVVDGAGAAVQDGAPQLSAGDRRALEVRVRPLERGTYTVVWRAVSRVDGHPTAGAFHFGVGVSPAGLVAAAPPFSSPAPPWTELAGRWFLLAGLAGLLGMACAAAGGYGVASGGAPALCALAASLAGLVLLADGQRRNAAGSLADLLGTPAGRALVWRGAAIVVAGAALAVARSRRRGVARPAMVAVAMATGVAMAADVAVGHAAGAHAPRWVNVAAQWSHFAAAGVWLGGLVALVLLIRRLPSAARAGAVRRFSGAAVGALLVVVATGTVRAVAELRSWSDLLDTGYGRAVLVKVVLLAGIVVLAAIGRGVLGAETGRNRPVSAPRSALVGMEIVLGVGALAAAAVLASVAPPVSARSRPAGLEASGADFGSSVRVVLRTASAEPGPNRFEVRVDDYDRGRPVPVDAVRLRFVPLDDPGVGPTELDLRPGPRLWSGAGANLAFDGRWRVTAVVQRGAGAVSVALELDIRGPPQFLSVEQLPGEPVRHTVELAAGGYARVWVEPERPGFNRVYASFFGRDANLRVVDQVVLTSREGSGPARRHPLRSLGEGRYVTDVAVGAERTKVAVVARTPDGTRLRATVDLDAEAG